MFSLTAGRANQITEFLVSVSISNIYMAIVALFTALI